MSATLTSWLFLRRLLLAMQHEASCPALLVLLSSPSLARPRSLSASANAFYSYCLLSIFICVGQIVVAMCCQECLISPFLPCVLFLFLLFLLLVLPLPSPPPLRAPPTPLPPPPLPNVLLRKPRHCPPCVGSQRGAILSSRVDFLPQTMHPSPSVSLPPHFRFYLVSVPFSSLSTPIFRLPIPIFPPPIPHSLFPLSASSSHFLICTAIAAFPSLVPSSHPRPSFLFSRLSAFLSQAHHACDGGRICLALSRLDSILY